MSAPVGETFGQLRVVGNGRTYERPSNGRRTVLWRVLCACGNVIDAQPSNLRAGRTQSCGCRPQKAHAPKPCAFIGCLRRHYAKGLCELHYRRHHEGRSLITGRSVRASKATS